MNAFDILIGVIILFGLIRGLFRGLIKEIFSITGVAAGYVVAFSLYPPLAELLAKYLPLADYSRLIAFLIIFGAVFLLVSIIGVIFKYLSKIPYFGWTDRTCGAFFGLIKGFLIVCVLFIAFAALPPKDGTMIKKSFLAPYLVHVPNQLIKITNRDMKKLFSESTEGLNKVWKRK